LSLFQGETYIYEKEAVCHATTLAINVGCRQYSASSLVPVNHLHCKSYLRPVCILSHVEMQASALASGVLTHEPQLTPRGKVSSDATADADTSYTSDQCRGRICDALSHCTIRDDPAAFDL